MFHKMTVGAVAFLHASGCFMCWIHGEHTANQQLEVCYSAKEQSIILELCTQVSKRTLCSAHQVGSRSPPPHHQSLHPATCANTRVVNAGSTRHDYRQHCQVKTSVQ